MTTITLDMAKENIATLINRALEGEEIVIATGGGKAIRLQPFSVATGKSLRGRGAFKGKLVVGREFLEPLPDEELKLWEGRAEE